MNLGLLCELDFALEGWVHTVITVSHPWKMADESSLVSVERALLRKFENAVERIEDKEGNE